MNKKIVIRTLLSISLLVIAATLTSYASIVGRWAFNLSGVLLYPLSLVILIGWIVYIACLLFRGKPDAKSLYWRVFVLISVVGFSIAVFRLAISIGEFVRIREIQRAVDLGLHEDCVALLENWPDSGSSRIFRTSDAYRHLPASIRLLQPVYVTNDALDYDIEPPPPSIGICKNGFAGFASGVRVFRDETAEAIGLRIYSSGRKRVAPYVYYWWNET